MAFSFNGNIPEIVTFNGNDVLVIKWNGTTVWEKNNEDYSTNYLTFVAKRTGRFKFSGSTSSNKISYSTDNGETWSTPTRSVDFVVNIGDTVMWKGTMTPNSTNGIGLFSASTASFDAQGNIMSLVYGDNFVSQTTLSGNYQFRRLFQNTKIINAKDLILPATTLTHYCYQNMFYNCTSLTTAPELPATSLATYCYNIMFRGCTSLTTAPSLPATTLDTYCYYNMFRDCSSLNYIKMLATDISASNCLTYWVDGVASSGTFVKAASMTSLPTGNSGIPNGWTVQNA